MVIDRLKRIYSALILPTNADESVNYDALRRLVRMQLADGVEGFYCCGSSGEGLLLTLDERKRIVETVLDEVAGQVPVIAHIGTIRTADVIELARHAAASGCAAISMIPPYYYKFTMDEICGYYEDTIAAVPEMPVIILQIEHRRAVENIDAILDTEGFDAVVFGPCDLSGSLGRLGALDDAELRGMIDLVLEKCRVRGIPAGVSLGLAPAQTLLDWKSRGVRLLSTGNEYNFMQQGAALLRQIFPKEEAK